MCANGLEDPECPNSNITNELDGAYSKRITFESEPRPGYRVARADISWINPCGNPPGIFDILKATKVTTTNIGVN